MKILNIKGFKTALTTAVVGFLPAAANAATLDPNDFVGISFWLISMALVAATAFFFIETTRVEGKWKTSLTVSGLVTLVAAVHYFYMREVWVTTGESPTVFRYIDWLITVPLLMVEFYLILRAITKVSIGIFWRLMIGTLVMLVAATLVKLVTLMPRLVSSLVCSVGRTSYMKSLLVKQVKLLQQKLQLLYNLLSQQCVGL